MEDFVKASDGLSIRISNRPEPFGGVLYKTPIPMMDPCPERAGKTIEAIGFKLSYDSLGYCHQRVKMN